MVDTQTQAAAAAQLIETWTDEQLEADYNALHADAKTVMTWADAVSLVDVACKLASNNGMNGRALRLAMNVITKGCH